MVNSIKKGKKFERLIANLLTKKTGLKFQRVPMSGGFSTSFNVKNNVFKGDVFTEAEELSYITIECKSYKNEVGIKDIFNKKSLLWSWINQSESESKKEDWILFFKWNHSKVYYIYKNEIIRMKLKLKQGLIKIHNYYLGVME